MRGDLAAGGALLLIHPNRDRLGRGATLPEREGAGDQACQHADDDSWFHLRLPKGRKGPC